MMYYSYGVTLLVLCPLIFLAAFIDAIAGGGGLISLPAYLFVGLPVHTAYGTNKFPASIGLLAAVANYIRNKCIDYPAALSGGICAFAGSLIGTRLALSLSPRALQICLMVILPAVGIFSLTKTGGENREARPPLDKRVKLFLCSATGLVCGCYDGFFGPGAGMFVTVALSGLVRLDLITAVGTGKLINFSSNITSMITWLLNGKIFFPVAVPCMVCSVAGSFLGSRMAIKAGKKFIRIILALVTLLLFAKIITDLF